MMLKVFFFVSVPTADMTVARVPLAEDVKGPALKLRCCWPDGRPGGKASHLLFLFLSSEKHN
jgi:hypothetical protein